MAKDERTTYTIQNDNSMGEVQVPADEVVAIIAALAATEVDGVASMAGNITNELVSRLGMKNLSKGVKVDVLEGVVTVSLALNLKYNYSIMDVTAQGAGSCEDGDREHDWTGKLRIPRAVSQAWRWRTGNSFRCKEQYTCSIIKDVVRHPFCFTKEKDNRKEPL